MLQLINSFALLGKLQLLVLTLSLELVNFSFNFCQLVPSDLKVSLSFKAHVLDLGLVSCVLLDNLIVLCLTILHDLSHHFLIVTLQSLNFLFELMNESPLFVYKIIVIFLVHIHSRGVLIVDLLLGGREGIQIRLLLCLQLVVTSSVLEHLLVVLIASGFKLLMLLLLQELQLFFKILLDVVLLGEELLVFVPGGDLGLR